MGYPAKPVDMEIVRRMVADKFTVAQICDGLKHMGVTVSPEAIRRRLRKAGLQTPMMVKNSAALSRGARRRYYLNDRETGFKCEKSDPWASTVRFNDVPDDRLETETHRAGWRGLPSVPAWTHRGSTAALAAGLT